MTAAVVLAAGAGRRLGGVAKACLRLADGRTFLGAVAETGAAAGVDAWVVVVGPPHQAETSALADELGLPAIVNPAPERGMASSVALGFEYAETHFSDHDSALLWPVDHPLVRVATVRTIVDQVRDQERGYAVVIACCHGRGGHPSAFARRTWPLLAGCADAPRGARSVIDALRARDRVCRMAIADSGLVTDVDTPEALAEVGGHGHRYRACER